jgi:glycosyltransferase involved in cell wall biosynthesis
MYVPNGVDAERFRPDPVSRAEKRAELAVGDAFVWVAVGSFNNEDKDQSNLLRAFTRLVEAGSSSALLVAGDGVLLDEKRGLAASLGVEGRVRFLGMCSDVPRLLRAADAYVLSSQQEAMPIAVLEAAATALPIVTTDVGDCSLVVKDCEGGFVVPRRDSDSLANAMLHVEAMAAGDRRRMGETAREFVVAEFSMSALVDRWERIYQDLGA